jgi:hypothetical protein
MSGRYADLRKLPREPARRLLALANAKLVSPISAPAAAPVDVVLEELEAAGAFVDTMRLLSAALPARECIWWGCLAAEDVLKGQPVPRPLAAAQAWVFKPTEENRELARLAVEAAEPDDETTLCATAVVMHDGKLGGGELAHYDAPPGGRATMIFGMNVKSLGTATPEDFAAHKELLIDRALDIARGGNGRLESRASSKDDLGSSAP